MMFWIVIAVRNCCCHITKSKSHNWFNSFRCQVLILHLHSTDLMEICFICMWECWSRLIIISLPRQKDSLSIKAKLVSSIPHQYLTNPFMHHCLTSSVHYHKSSKTNSKISSPKISLTKAISFYFSLKQTTFTDGCKKSNINTHGILKDQCHFISNNWLLLCLRIGMKVSILLTESKKQLTTRCRHSIPDISYTRTLNKQLSMAPWCLSMARLPLSTP